MPRSSFYSPTTKGHMEFSMLNQIKYTIDKIQQHSLQKGNQNKKNDSLLLFDINQKVIKKRSDKKLIDTYKIEMTKSFKGKQTKNKQIQELPKMKKKQLQTIKKRIQIMKKKINQPTDPDSKKIMNKLKQIVNITNTQKKQQDKKGILRNNSILGNKNIIQTAKKQQQIMQKYWQHYQQKKVLSHGVLQKIKNNRINIIIQKMKNSQEISNQNTQNKQNNKINRASYCSSIAKMNNNNKIQRYHKINSSKSQIELKKTNKIHKIHKDILLFIKKQQQQKGIIKTFNPSFVSSSDAKDLYLFAKGGYNPDSIDVEGGWLSLNMFNEAKQKFQILQDFYNITKQKINAQKYNSMHNSSQKQDLDNSFQSIVKLNEKKQKILPRQFSKLMKICKLVS